MSELSIFEHPTPAQVLGPMHYQNFMKLMALELTKWQSQRQTLAPIIQDLTQQLEPFTGDKLTIEYHPPETHHIGDTCGDGSHLFFLRLPKDSQTMKPLPRLLQRRTAVIIAVDDLSEPWGNAWVQVAVTKSLRRPVRDQVLALASEYVRRHITAAAGTKYESHLGFSTNIGQINYCGLRTQLLQW